MTEVPHTTQRDRDYREDALVRQDMSIMLDVAYVMLAEALENIERVGMDIIELEKRAADRAHRGLCPLEAGLLKRAQRLREALPSLTRQLNSVSATFSSLNDLTTGTDPD